MTQETQAEGGTQSSTGAEAGGADPAAPGPAGAQTRLDLNRRGRRSPNRSDERLERFADAIERGIKFVPDRTANETHYSRSKKIRVSLGLFVLENENTAWESWRQFRGEACLYAKCGPETADRWFEVLLLPRNAPWEVVDLNGGNTGMIIRRKANWLDADIAKFLRNMTPGR